MAALFLLPGACAQPEHIGSPPRPILDVPDEPPGTPSASSTDPAPTSSPSSTAPATASPLPGALATSGTPASSSQAPAPPMTSPASKECLSQFTVVTDTYARDSRAGNQIGRVPVGTHVNVRQSDGIWAYGYVAYIEGRGGGWAWMLHQQMRRTGQFCG